MNNFAFSHFFPSYLTKRKEGVYEKVHRGIQRENSNKNIYKTQTRLSSSSFSSQCFSPRDPLFHEFALQEDLRDTKEKTMLEAHVEICCGVVNIVRDKETC